MEKEKMKEIKELAKALTLSKRTPRNVFLEKEFIKVKNNLTALQKKLVYYAFSQVTEEDRTKTPIELAEKTIRINVNEFLEMFNMKNKGGKIYQDIEREVKKIGRTPVQIQINAIKDSTGARQKIKRLIESEIYWFAKVDYIKDESKCSFIEIQFTHTIWSFLTQFENYVKYNYFISHSLKSKHSIKIYELLQSRKDTNEIITTIDNFVYMLDLTDTYKSKYQLRYYVLEKAKKELNEKLDLGFDYYIDTNNILHIKATLNDDDLVEKIFTNEQIDSFKIEEMKLKEFKKLGTSKNLEEQEEQAEQRRATKEALFKAQLETANFGLNLSTEEEREQEEQAERESLELMKNNLVI